MVKDHTLEVLYHMRDRLKEMRLGRIIKDKGICYHLERESHGRNTVISMILRGYFREWHLYSGHVAYPVPSDKYGAHIAYDIYHANLWDRRTTYGKRRYMLLEHIYHCVTRSIRGREKSLGRT